MGDVPLDTIRGALDEVICILKREGAKDAERKKEIESLEIDRLTDTEFNTLTVLGQQLTDFSLDGVKIEGEQEPDEQMNELPVDPEMEFSNRSESSESDIDKVKDD